MVIASQNIEQKPGYKQTEVGLIPEDWKLEKLGNYLLDAPDYGINAPATQYTDNLPKYIRITDITENGSFSPEKIASVRHISADKYILQAGDLVFARTGASVGKTYLYKPEDGVLVFAGYLIRVRVNPSKLLSDYLAAYLKTEYYWRWVRVMSMRSGQPGINGNEYAQLPIPLPSLPEQQAIATALSDVDALIASLDQLIAKKRDIKQATMQQLLTGKTRLSGFSGEWQSFNMADNSILKARIGWQGLTTAEYLKEGKYYLVTGTDFIDGKIEWDTCHFIDANRYDQDKNIQLRVGDVLLTKDGTIGKAAYINYLPGLATLNSGVFVIRPSNNKYYSLYLYYVLSSSIFDVFLSQLKAGSTISHLYQKDFVSFNFLAPYWEEQQAIATVLSDMDAEIVVLEQRREKTRELKQGMMQELLTGKTRLL